MPRYIGVDPGVKGALCLLDTSQHTYEFFPTPSKVDLISPSMVLHWLNTQNIIDNPTRIIGIEDVHSIFGVGAKSNFQFGRYLGQIETICSISKIGIERVQPKVWQKVTGIIFPKGSKPVQRKKIIAAKVLEIYPNANIFGPRGGLADGKADALLIAHYMNLRYGGAK